MGKKLGYIDETIFTNIADAIRTKNGTSTTYKPGNMADAIANITTEPDEATPVSTTIVPGGSTSIPAGYYKSAGSVSASLATTLDQIDSSVKETKTGTGSLTSNTTVTATSGKLMTSVTVSKPVMTSATATASDIVSGKKAYGSDGTLITGTIELLNYYTGTEEPSSSLGVTGELYIQTS